MADPAVADEGGAGFGAQWDARFVHPVRRTVVACLDEHRSMQTSPTRSRSRYNADAFHAVVYAESHDEVANGKARVPHEIAPDDPEQLVRPETVDAGGDAGVHRAGHSDALPGAGVPAGRLVPRRLGRSTGIRLIEHRGIVRLYRDLIALRRNLRRRPAGCEASGLLVFHVNDADNVVAFQRWSRDDEQDTVVVIVNLSHCTHDHYAMGFPAAGRWKVILNTDATCYSPGFAGRGPVEVLATDEARHPLPATVCLQIPAYTALLFIRN